MYPVFLRYSFYPMPRLWDLRLQWDSRISLYYAQWQYSIYPYICVFRKQALSNKHSSTYFNMRQNSRKRDVHSFHCVWQLYIVTPPEQEKKNKIKTNFKCMKKSKYSQELIKNLLTFWPSALCCTLDWDHWKSVEIHFVTNMSWHTDKNWFLESK